MSDVADGPDTNVSGRPSRRPPRARQPPPEQPHDLILPNDADMKIRNEAERPPPLPAPASRTNAPTSAMATAQPVSAPSSSSSCCTDRRVALAPPPRVARRPPVLLQLDRFGPPFRRQVSGDPELRAPSSSAIRATTCPPRRTRPVPRPTRAHRRPVLRHPLREQRPRSRHAPVRPRCGSRAERRPPRAAHRRPDAAKDVLPGAASPRSPAGGLRPPPCRTVAALSRDSAVKGAGRSGRVRCRRVRRHHSRNVSGAGAGRSRDIVQPASGPGARESVAPAPMPLAANGRLAARASFCARS